MEISSCTQIIESAALGTRRFSAVLKRCFATISSFSFQAVIRTFILSTCPGKSFAWKGIRGIMPNTRSERTKPEGPAVLLSAFTDNASDTLLGRSGADALTLLYI